MKKHLSLCCLSIILITNTVYAQSIDIKNSRSVILNTGNPLKELNIRIDTSKVQALGLANIDDLKLLGNNKATNISGISSFTPHVAGKFYNFQYDGIFIIQSKSNADPKTLNKNPKQNLELYYTIRAIEVLKFRYTFLYQKLVQSLVNPQVQSNEPQNFKSWYNRYPKIVISFNTGSGDVAISGTYLDQNSIGFNIHGQSMSLFENIPVISINSDIIKGTNQAAGSYPIYKKANAEENYMLYLKEGLMQSICHELIHRYFDINNVKIGSISNFIAFGNGRRDTSDPSYDRHAYNLEEVIVNRTLDKYFRQSGGLSADLLDYYLKVENDLLASIPNIDSYKSAVLTTKYINQDLSLEL